MVTSSASTVSDYIASLPPDRRAQVKAIRDLVKKNLPRGYEETMQYGMISWVVPLSRYPNTYNGQPLAIASLASQKQHLSLYLLGAYGKPSTRARLEAGFRAAGKKLDIGKSCLRWKQLTDLPLEVVAEAIADVGVDEYIRIYEASRKAPAKRVVAKKAPAKRVVAKKAAAKKATAKRPAGRRK